jgi:hypothetical protein
MLNFLVLIFLFLGNPVYPHGKRDAQISKKDMDKALVFVRKDAAQCRRELRHYKIKFAELYADANKKKRQSK